MPRRAYAGMHARKLTDIGEVLSTNVADDTEGSESTRRD